MNLANMNPKEMKIPKNYSSLSQEEIEYDGGSKGGAIAQIVIGAALIVGSYVAAGCMFGKSQSIMMDSPTETEQIFASRLDKGAIFTGMTGTVVGGCVLISGLCDLGVMPDLGGSNSIAGQPIKR